MSKKIMIVDDSRIAQMQLQKALSDSEYEVVACCQNGEDAVVQYENIKPDLVTMDILMPGIDGLETTRRILEIDPKAKILIVSSLAYDDTLEEARNIGANGFIYKPFEKDKILKELDDIFEK